MNFQSINHPTTVKMKQFLGRDGKHREKCNEKSLLYTNETLGIPVVEGRPSLGWTVRSALPLWRQRLGPSPTMDNHYFLELQWQLISQRWLLSIQFQIQESSGKPPALHLHHPHLYQEVSNRRSLKKKHCPPPPSGESLPAYC